MQMRVFIDCTDTYVSGSNTGIQRVVRNFVQHAGDIGSSLGLTCIPFMLENGIIVRLDSLDHPFKGPRQTLRGSLNRAYLAAVRRIASLLPFPPLQRLLLAHRSQPGLSWLLFLPFQMVARLRPSAGEAQPSAKGIERTFGPDDILFLPDASWSVDIFGLVARARAKGTRIVFFLHDIIPLTHPQVCHPVHVERFRKWFEQVTGVADLLICNSRFTQQCVADHLAQFPGTFLAPSEVVYLGHDLGPLATGEIRHSRLRSAFAASPASFLCVGTLEPRKNLDTLINAFELLWNDGHQVSLILIGREGWLCDDLLVRIRRHGERGKRLFWLNDVGDADLALAYRQASALIFPSVVEGFGLPLVEALSQGLPVVASDIPVFKEIAGSHGRFFPPHDPHALARALIEHLSAGSNSRTSGFQWPTWEESTQHLLGTLRAFADRPSSRG
jgi:O-antigen biosynthesis alpha-1,2-rhamnosyltransferase